MPATARKHQLQGSLLYHIINRGNRRDDVFHQPQDYQYFLKLLSNYSVRFEMIIYHWVLMPNHYHLLLEMKSPENLSRMMAGIARSYVHYYQKRYNLGGHIWQGRFRSQPIEKERYLLACGRYIERNPVKANIVNSAEDYEYSSARFYCIASLDKLTTENPYFEAFGKDTVERRKNYTEFLKAFDEQEESLFKEDETPVCGSVFKTRLIYEHSRYLPRRKGSPIKLSTLNT